MDRKIEFDFPGREPACSINWYIERGGLDGIELKSKGGVKLLKEIFKTLKGFKCVKAHGDEFVSLFLEAPKGRIEEFGNYEELHEYGEYESYEDFERDWNYECKKESKWYYFESVKTYNDFYAIFLNHKKTFAINPLDEYTGKVADWSEEYLFPYLKWINNALKRALEMLKEGTYNDYVNKYLDLGSRKGTVSRSDFWKVFPEVKKEYFEDMSQEDVDEFLQLMEQGIGVEKPTFYLKEMTLGLYLKACALGYRANYDDDPSLTPKELYRKHGDRRDDGLLEIEEDSPEAFENWDPHADENFNGFHHYEVVMGHSNTRIFLSPIKREEGYYFHVGGGDSYWRSKEIIRFFLAIHRAGYPIVISNGPTLAKRFIGNDKIGILPHGLLPGFCYGAFPKEENIIDTMNFNEDEDKGLLPYIKWQEIEKVEPAN